MHLNRNNIILVETIVYQNIMTIIKNTFLVFDKRPANDINNSVGSGDTFSIKFTKSNTKFCLSLH